MNNKVVKTVCSI